tara:strand:- start:4521 stop:5657 length:1137 start_codon:yes stop_codon:yes gene_type:complete
MAVEYIDSPNAGFVKLGEGVDLSTITPQRKRKVKKGDRAIFPITPTGAESYETTDFRPAAGFTSPASTIPNVFERYRTVPGGARAGGAGPSSSFERVILPINPNGTKESITEDLELEEQLRRKSFDIGLDADPSGRTDPSSPNYDPQAQADIDKQVAENEAMMQAGISLKDAIKVGILDKQYQMTGGDKGRSFNHSLESAYLTGDPFAKYTIEPGSSEGYVPGTGGKPGTIGDQSLADFYGFGSITDTIGGGAQGRFSLAAARQGTAFEGRGDIGSTGGAGFTTDVPKASSFGFNFRSTSPGNPFGGLGPDRPDPEPEVTGGELDFSFDLGGFDFDPPGGFDVPTPDTDAAADVEAAGIDVGTFGKDGGTVSFMGMKK